MSVNERIRHYIKSNGMTFTFVANKASIDVKKFSRIMNDKQKMTTDEYERICKHGLHVDPTFFYSNKFLDSKKNTA